MCPTEAPQDRAAHWLALTLLWGDLANHPMPFTVQGITTAPWDRCALGLAAIACVNGNTGDVVVNGMKWDMWRSVCLYVVQKV